ncbi:MAG: glycosyltransferase [Magnetococcales bacterium]|nr:glycosyltransferase [Magnetococcales bacterium]
MLKRVLIVSPHFPPLNTPDHQRVRFSLPYYKEFGWQAHVLAVDAEHGDGNFDPLLEGTIPADIEVTRLTPYPRRITRRFGVGNLGLRALPRLYRTGLELLRHADFDLVYFSTTVFHAMSLGPLWKKKTGIPYIIDIQDPWRDPRHFQSPRKEIPGGLIKFSLDYLINGFEEAWVMRHVDHVISVSSHYIDDLCKRFPRMTPSMGTDLPFGASSLDYEMLDNLEVSQEIFQPDDGFIHWVYVGRSSMDMAAALRTLFCAIRAQRRSSPHRWQKVKLHFIGTSYSPKGCGIKSVEPIAAEYGLNDMVEEQTNRVSFFQALKLLADSDGILFISSDDPRYSASKAYPLILAKRPLLSVIHQEGPIREILETCKAGHMIPFDPKSDSNRPSTATLETLNHFLGASEKGDLPATDWEAFKPYTAHEMTRRQCKVFDKITKK